MGVQIGEHNLQVNYTYNMLTWTDGVAPPPLVSTSGQVDSPYRGLGAFDERDAAFFFGRETAATQVLERMSRQLDDAGPLVVSGVSGAGKSSLLRAGVVPRIRGGGLASASGAAHWPCLLFTPAHAPLDELAVRVASLAGADASTVRRGLDADPAGFALTAHQAALTQAGGPPGDHGGPRPGLQQRLLLVVDQFEQLFTRCPDEQQRQNFITALHAAATARHGAEQAPAALVVLAVRADFEARCADYPQLADAIQYRYLLTSMTELELRMAITEPAKMAGSSVDDDLVDVLLQEVRTGHPTSAEAISGFGGISSTGVLPLLSHALDQAWRNRTGNILTLADYERTGRIARAVADSAQDVYERLTPAQQAVTRQVFTRLTAVGSEGMDTADRVARQELTEAKNTAATQDVEVVLEAFAAERLLTLAADTVEISHEVLLTAWPLLRDAWLADTHADRIVRTRLHNVAAEWARQSRDTSYLYSGSLLEAAARIEAQPSRLPPLSTTERDFLQASDRAHRHRMRRRRNFIAFLMILVIGLASATIIALQQRTAALTARNQALSARNLAIASQILTKAAQLTATDLSLAAQLYVVANQISPTLDSKAQLVDTTTTPLSSVLTGPADLVSSVAFSRNGRILAAGGYDGKVWLWNLADPARPTRLGQPLTGPAFVVTTVAISPDGKTLAAGGSDGKVWLWNLADPARPARLGKPLTGPGGLTGSTGLVSSLVAFSPDGKTLAAGGYDGKVWLWNLADPARPARLGQPLTGPAGPVNSVAFSLDRKTLAVSGGGKVWLWNLADPARPARLGQPLTGPAGPVSSMAFSSDRKTLAAGSDDHTVWLWNLADPAHPARLGQPLTGPADSVYSVAFSPDGRTLAAASADGKVWLWNLADPAHPARLGQPLTDPAGGVYSVAFSPDRKTLATGSGGRVRLWNLPSNVLIGPPGGVGSVAVSPDGKTLAAGGSDGKVWLWNLADPARPARLSRPLTGPAGGVYSVAFSPDRKTLAAGGNDHTVWLWNLADPGRPVRLGKPLTGPPIPVGSVAFSPDGKTLATASADEVLAVEPGRSGPPRPARPAPDRPCRLCQLSSVQRGPKDPGHRRWRRQGLAVEPGRSGPPCTARPAADRPDRRCLLGDG